MVNLTAATAGTAYTLSPCPSSLNCISSQSLGNRAIEPFPLVGEAKSAFNSLKERLKHRKDTTIVSADDREIAVEFKTLLGFVDDGLFVLDLDNKVIHVRSASRIGYWDLGKNRRRMEGIRHEYLNSMKKP